MTNVFISVKIRIMPLGFDLKPKKEKKVGSGYNIHINSIYIGFTATKNHFFNVPKPFNPSFTKRIERSSAPLRYSDYHYIEF